MVKRRFSKLRYASQNDSLFRYAPIGLHIAKYFIQIRISERRSLIIWFRSGLRSGIVRHSDRDFGVWLIIWFRSELRSMCRESFDSDRNFGVRVENYLIQTWTSERISLIIWVRPEPRSVYANNFIQIRTLEHVLRIIWFSRNFGARVANNLI